MKNLTYFKAQVRKALRKGGKYTEALEPQIYTLASALRTLDKANEEIDKLTSLTVKSSQGLVAHPLMRIRKEAEDSVTKQMRSIGLSDMRGGVAPKEEGSPLEDLLKAVNGVD